MTLTAPFTQLDVFSDVPGLGNPLAVVHDADAWTSAQMQAFARWTNLSETTFLCRPNDPAADYALRIFTPQHEMRFAGHPTLGSAQAFLLAGGTPKDSTYIVQECGIGQVRIRRDRGRLAFAAPTLTQAPVPDDTLQQTLRALGLAPERVRACSWLDNGARWLALQLDDHHVLRALTPDHAALGRLHDVGIIAPYAEQGCLFEVRAFAAASGIPEDPVTGSLNAAFAQWLSGAAGAPSDYVVAQGSALGRRGRVHVTHGDDGEVWIGGYATPIIQGQVQFT